MSEAGDYFLGTHDEEVARLGLQHSVWRARAHEAWVRGGFTRGQVLMDVGCGPGHASLDLAELVGPTGQVVAIDRSPRFLKALDSARLRRGLENIRTVELDLDDADLPAVAADGAWCRWALTFLKHPRAAVERVAARLKPGGAIVLHEYFDYATWRLAPRSPELEEFVRLAMESWREDGGEPDIALELPRWLPEVGFTLREVRPLVDVVPPSSFVWQWPREFVRVGLPRLVQLGRLSPVRAGEIWEAFEACEAAPDTLMITPAVLEIIAVRA